MAEGDIALGPATVLGIGAVTAMGRELESIAARLGEPSDASAKVLPVSDELLADPGLSRNLRRADRFTRMAVLAAVDAWKAAEGKCAGVGLERVGMILSSGFGPHCRGFKFLDGLIDEGDAAASPTDFSHSVHGAACAYISGLLGVRGPSITMTDFESGFEEAVLLAQCWLCEGACERVLIGAAEEIGEVLLYCASRMVDKSRKIVPGEGAVFMVLGPADVKGGAARISGTAARISGTAARISGTAARISGTAARISGTSVPARVDLLIVEPEAAPVSDRARFCVEARETITFSGHFGESASGTAFGLLGGLLSLGAARDGRAIDNAATLRTRSDGRAATLLLEQISS